MKKNACRITIALCTALGAFSLSACGGGDTASTSFSQIGETAVQAAKDLSGVAAVGRPISGNVYLSDSSIPARSASVAINPDGTFCFSSKLLKDLKAPYLLKAVEPSGTTWYSLAKAGGTANVNPFTTLALAVASGSKDPQALSELYELHSPEKLDAVSQSLRAALSDVMSALKPLLAGYGAADDDALAGAYQVNQQGLDGFLDQAGFSVSQGVITITNKSDGSTIFSAQLQDLAAGNAIVSAMPAPAPLNLSDDAVLTLAIDGVLPRGRAIKSATFTLQLPAGVTIDTADPIGAAAGSNLYPASGLSRTGNNVTITLSSLNGFGAGRFLTLNCNLGGRSITTMSAAEFPTVTSRLYADIYQTEPLEGLTVVPTELAQPTKSAYTHPVRPLGEQ